MCMNNEGEYGKYVIQDNVLPPFLTTPEFIKDYHEIGRRRALWLDDKSAPGGGFSMNTTWIVHADRDIQKAREAADGVSELGKPHAHETNEILGFLGSNPDDPSDLCGEVEIFIEGEQHVLTKSSILYLPAGMKHVPLYINRVDRPIFHFFVTFSPSYTMVREDDTFEV